MAYLVLKVTNNRRIDNYPLCF
ncbi:hypothetical protein KL86PLE_100526 [uncultured Pleomorphomonas sp.]|uniref:Uncharacterized protein n=1 Tax=uncultured Pleomorphomonas sp. TaxID=442121 RepID=A0A212L3Z3_9HYPH|nr:hypothetical protein KL86PLE_100526 [uncultured Pleomorphomonas sp.]